MGEGKSFEENESDGRYYSLWLIAHPLTHLGARKGGDAMLGVTPCLEKDNSQLRYRAYSMPTVVHFASPIELNGFLTPPQGAVLPGRY